MGCTPGGGRGGLRRGRRWYANLPPREFGRSLENLPFPPRWPPVGALWQSGSDRSLRIGFAVLSHEELAPALAAAAQAGPEFLCPPPQRICALANELSEIRTASA